MLFKFYRPLCSSCWRDILSPVYHLLISLYIMHQWSARKHTHIHLCVSYAGINTEVLMNVRINVFVLSREGQDMDPLLSDPRISLLTNGTLELSDIDHDDSGVYTCSVQHTNISITAHLEVFSESHTSETTCFISVHKILETDQNQQHVSPYLNTSWLLFSVCGSQLRTEDLNL